MNNQAIKIIIAVFITLSIIAAFPWLEKKFRSDKSDSKKNVSVNLAGFTKQTTEKITFKKGANETTLQMKDGKWQVGSEDADEKKVELFFDDLQEMEIVRLASQNEDKHKDLQVTKEDGITLTLTQDGKDSVYFIGKIGPQAGSFYIRKDGIKSTHLAAGTLRDKASWDATKWKPDPEDSQEKTGTESTGLEKQDVNLTPDKL